MSLHTIHEDEEMLRKASDAYHNGEPIMSDAEYDKIWQRHLASRTNNPGNSLWGDTILDKVGAAPRSTSGFRKVKHLTPMMSLDNVFVQTEGDQLADLNKWIARLGLGNDVTCVIEPKIDGLSASVIYEDGILSRVVTRGDGEEGDDITANAIAAGLVPQSILPDEPFDGYGAFYGITEVRGEIYMTFAAFHDLCDQALAAGTQLPANPRNAAAGIIRRKDSTEVPANTLKFLVHGFETPRHETYLDDRAEIVQLGFAVATCVTFKFDEPLIFDVVQWLSKQSFPTDGLVFKLDSYNLRKALGCTSRAPRWAVALKLEQEQVETTCRDITVQVGRSGILTPVAELVPVAVDGTTVSRATLHNESQINRLGLYVGAKVVLQKAGGIIPEIVSVIQTLPIPVEKFSLPKHIDYQCPCCGSSDILVDGDIEHSMVLAEIKRKNASLDIEDGGKINLGKLRRNLAAVVESLSEATIEKLRADNFPDFQYEDFKRMWLSEMVLHITADGLRYTCGNTSGCKAQMAGRIEHMASRGCLNIIGLGAEACDAIAQLGEIEHPFDILDKPVEWFANLSWVTDAGKNMTFGTARATKVVEACRNIGKQPLHRWITSLGIHSIGENTGKEISRLFCNARQLTALRKRLREDVAVDAICRIAAGEDKKSDALMLTKCSNHLGPVSCKALIDFVDSDAGLTLLERIHEFGVRSDNHDPIPTVDEAGSSTKALAGKTFAITGTLSQPRDHFKGLIMEAGGKVTDTISAKLTALVCGEGGGGKRDKAAKLGIPVWDESQLMKEVNG